MIPKKYMNVGEVFAEDEDNEHSSEEEDDKQRRKRSIAVLKSL